ncbi:MAG: SRPBCC domain-containing protein [Polyangiales bacterium]
MTGPGPRTRQARAIADVTAGTILASVDIAAPPERVFRAISSPEELVRWWGSDEMYRTTKWDADFRVDGRWRSEGVGADGVPFSVEGEYLEIDPPRKLVQTWRPEWDGGHTTTLTYLLEVIDSGTRLTVRHEGFGANTESCRSHASGWEFVLGWLQGFAEPAPEAAADSFFLFRLLPPRPSFALDMNEQEKALMQQHGAHWQARLQAGGVVVFGPVADPTGPWGLGILRAKDRAEVEAFGDSDPTIRSGTGFRYEILPLITAILP